MQQYYLSHTMPISSLWNKYKIIVLQCRNTVCQCITRPVTVTQQMPSSSFAIQPRAHCAGLPSAACEEEPCLCSGRRQATRLLFLNIHDSLVCSACHCRKSRAILLCNISRCLHCARLYFFWHIHKPVGVAVWKMLYFKPFVFPGFFHPSEPSQKYSTVMITPCRMVIVHSEQMLRYAPRQHDQCCVFVQHSFLKQIHHAVTQCPVFIFIVMQTFTFANTYRWSYSAYSSVNTFVCTVTLTNNERK